MEFESIDMSEFTKQRYKSIKNSGKYIETNILIGAEKETIDGKIGRLPVVRTTIHDCGPEEIASMYVTLKVLIKQYQEDYPKECLLAEFAMDTDNLATHTEMYKDIDEESEE